MFVAGIFTEIRPVWVGDLENRPTNLNSLCLGPYITLYFLGAEYLMLGRGLGPFKASRKLTAHIPEVQIFIGLQQKVSIS
jgi:hypothetical protein